jgi:hypothetical protein
VVKELKAKKGFKRQPLEAFLNLKRKVNSEVFSKNLKIGNAILYIKGWEEDFLKEELDYFESRDLKAYLKYTFNSDILVKIGQRRVEVKGVPFYDSDRQVVYLIKENYLLGMDKHIGKKDLVNLKKLLLENENNSFKIKSIEEI